jgi:hypothetical protein
VHDAPRKIAGFRGKSKHFFGKIANASRRVRLRAAAACAEMGLKHL